MVDYWQQSIYTIIFISVFSLFLTIYYDEFTIIIIYHLFVEANKAFIFIMVLSFTTNDNVTLLGKTVITVNVFWIIAVKMWKLLFIVGFNLWHTIVPYLLFSIGGDNSKKNTLLSVFRNYAWNLNIYYWNININFVMRILSFLFPISN